MQIPAGKKVYFLSDFHLGVPDHAASIEREKKIITFLDIAKQDAAMIFIVGDLFDFWFEYRTVVPKGYVRVLGKLAELTDNQIPVHFFVGNHDMWMSGYFEKELNIPVFDACLKYEFNGKLFWIGHGDGLGPGDYGYKFLKKIFRNPVCRFLFGLLPPFFGITLANFFSRRSRIMTGRTDEQFLGEDKEWLVQYAKEKLKDEHIDFFIFGHRHLPINFDITANSKYINLGDWIRYFSYAEFDGNTVQLKYYK